MRKTAKENGEKGKSRSGKLYERQTQIPPINPAHCFFILGMLVILPYAPQQEDEVAEKDARYSYAIDRLFVCP